jgi:hypothetical protein
MSNQTRRITKEPRIKWAVKAAKKKEPGAYDIVLILPQRMAAYLAGGLDQAVSSKGKQLRDYKLFRGEYRMKGGRLALDFSSGVLKSGGRESLKVHLVL